MPVSRSSYSGSVRASTLVFFERLGVKEGGLAVLVQIPHVRVCRSRVQIEAIFFDVLLVATLGARETE
jgi:hypothetical protein